MSDPAGIAGRAPAPSYRVEGLSFGSATLRRETAAPWGWRALELTRATGTSTFRAALTPLGDDDLAVIAAGVVALLRDHRLLGRPELLRDGRADDIPAGSPAAEALSRMAARVPPDPAEGAVCESCAARKGPSPRCPHAGMRDEALLVLCLLNPELAFERAGVLAASATRFVLPTGLARRVLGDVLAPAADVTRVERVAPQGDSLSPRVREAVALAARAWGFDDAPARLARSHGIIDDAWPAHFGDAGVERFGVAHEAPATVAAEPPKPAKDRRDKPAKEKPEPAKAAPAKAASAKAEPAKAEPATAATDGAVPQGLFMATGLKEMGYGPAEVKRLLKDGTLAREGFGWYRFTRAPT